MPVLDKDPYRDIKRDILSLKKKIRKARRYMSEDDKLFQSFEVREPRMRIVKSCQNCYFPDFSHIPARCIAYQPLVGLGWTKRRHIIKINNNWATHMNCRAWEDEAICRLLRDGYDYDDIDISRRRPILRTPITGRFVFALVYIMGLFSRWRGNKDEHSTEKGRASAGSDLSLFHKKVSKDQPWT